MNTEYLDIPSCPKCKDGHRFRLNVERAIVMRMLTTSDIDEQPRQVRITRLFTCPNKNDEFQASFTLTDTSSSRIVSVKVESIAHDNDNK
jgi:hypothetical protein